MNAARLEQILLLEQSGELSSKQRRILDAELAANPAARQLRAELQRLAAAIPPAGAAPAPGTATRIAARLGPARPPAAAFPPAWKPALAAAAAFALLLGVRTYHGKTVPAGATAPAVAAAAEDEWSDPLDADFTELENLLTSIAAENPFDTTEL